MTHRTIETLNKSRDELLQQIKFLRSNDAGNIFTIDHGKVKCNGLASTKEYHIGICKMDKGGVMDAHDHNNSEEYLFVLCGIIDVTVFGNDHEANINTIAKGEAITIRPGIKHSVVAREDSKLIYITIPPEEAYATQRQQ